MPLSTTPAAEAVDVPALSTRTARAAIRASSMLVSRPAPRRAFISVDRDVDAKGQDSGPVQTEDEFEEAA